uniref:Uncharacterized protein n=1 Tax=Ditylenchus dipsaci TaxID=166011 RepID=A0A915DPA9_9BILA
MESPGMSRLQSVWLSFNVKDIESVESFDPSLAFRNGVVRAEKLPAYCSTLMFAFRNNYTPLLQLDGWLIMFWNSLRISMALDLFSRNWIQRASGEKASFR